MAEEKPAEPPKTIKVKLKKPHIHRNIAYTEEDIKKGVEIEITAAQKDSLTKLGVV